VGRARQRQVRGRDGGLALTPRRARCRGCWRTHVLLPVTCLARRADEIAYRAGNGVALEAQASSCSTFSTPSGARSSGSSSAARGELTSPTRRPGLFHVAAHPAADGDVARPSRHAARGHAPRDRLEDKGFVTRGRRPGRSPRLRARVTRPAVRSWTSCTRCGWRPRVGAARMSADDRTRVVRGLEALVEASVEVAER